MILTRARLFRCHGRITDPLTRIDGCWCTTSATWWRVSPPVGGHGPGQNSPSIEGGSMQPHELPPPCGWSNSSADSGSPGAICRRGPRRRRSARGRSGAGGGRGRAGRRARPVLAPAAAHAGKRGSVHRPEPGVRPDPARADADQRPSLLTARPCHHVHGNALCAIRRPHPHRPHRPARRRAPVWPAVLHLAVAPPRAGHQVHRRDGEPDQRVEDGRDRVPSTRWPRTIVDVESPTARCSRPSWRGTRMRGVCSTFPMSSSTPPNLASLGVEDRPCDGR